MSTTSPNPAIASKNLSRLLSRLDQKLRTTPNTLERQKIAANLDYSRQLLHTLEAHSNNITIPSRKQKELADLAARKKAISKLNESLQTAIHTEDAAEDGEDGAGAPSAGFLSVPPTPRMGEQTDDDDDYVSLTRARPMKRRPSAVKRDMAREEKLEALERQEKEEEKSQAQPHAQATQHLAPSSGVRNRLPKPQQTAKPPAAASGTFTSVPPSYQSDNPDAILDMQRSEQEVIEKDLLSMAKMLRESTMEFSRHLEDEKDILAKAKEGLDKNVAGMQSTGSKMDNLRKNETVSWYWGIIYMAIIVALVFLVLLVLFFAPKLRWR
ncbi:Similar to hypothetical protein [Tuber melanosporum Mel28]; acc. no. XP_002838552 [Pyronema omphalodes CBS 100304]|uniref:Uncharacterized protein n=1 Tax=Pyronema omphalodes (strain CBS 100304) TaxID=1076935 RepID=U4LDI6_PYROM|nr:Similar to hypothetical protein [Tuber melanosporum Mel28]; acc. no. XP_002838552 [Pyronema omphalodes CBS 100304]